MKKYIDTLYSGGVFHTLRSEGEVFNYLGVTGGRISYLSDMRPDSREYKKEIKLDGLHVFPSFTDAHIHLLYTIALAGSGFDICEIRDGKVTPDSIAGVEKRLRTYCESYGPDDIIYAGNYIASAIAEKRMPTRQELDEWTGGRQAIVLSIDGHSCSLSTAFLRVLDFDPEGHSGILTGAEYEQNQGRITGALGSSIGIAELARGIANFTNQCARFGITRICALDGNGDSPDDKLTKIIAVIARRMDIDVFIYPQYMDLEKARPLWKKSRRARIGGCGDWSVDGAVGSHSAAFYDAYIDTGEIAECYYSQETVDDVVQRADAEG